MGRLIRFSSVLPVDEGSGGAGEGGGREAMAISFARAGETLNDHTGAEPVFSMDQLLYI